MTPPPWSLALPAERRATLTQDELGARAGLSRSFVAIFETGTHGIDVISLR